MVFMFSLLCKHRVMAIAMSCISSTVEAFDRSVASGHVADWEDNKAGSGAGAALVLDHKALKIIS